jgi:hypothetical protein
MKKSLILSLFFCNSFCFSQTITFEKSFDLGFAENGYAVKQTFDGGYIVTGRQGIALWVSKVPLLKLDSLGNQEWLKLINTSPNHNDAYDIKQTADSGYIITGGISNQAYDVYLIKTDKEGDTLWTKSYSGPGLNYDIAYSVWEIPGSGYVLAGKKNIYAWLLRTDLNGDTLWTKSFNPPGFESVAFSVFPTSDNGFILSGVRSDQFSNYATYIIKTDSLGDTLWTKLYWGSGWRHGYDIIETNSGEYIICGIGDNNNTFILKLDAAGDSLWEKTYSAFQSGRRVREIAGQGYAFMGTRTFFSPGYNEIYLVKTDYNGNILWQRTFGDSIKDYIGYDIDLCSDGGFVITGNSSGDLLVIKTDSSGQLLTNINNLENDFDIQVYPNPFSIEATIEIKGINNLNAKNDLSIWDLNGRKIKELKLINGKSRISSEGLISGIYFIKLKLNNDTRVITRKLIFSPP